MTAREPNLLTLLQWSRQMAAGQPCAEWDAWVATSPEAARKWQLAAVVQQRLASGLAPSDPTEAAGAELGATDVAEYVDGELSPAAAQEVEAICWQSPSQLCEVASASQFASESTELAEVSRDLTQRLLAIGPRAANRRFRRALRSAAAEPAPEPTAVASAIAPTLHRRVAGRDADALRHWPLAAAAAVLVVLALGGALGWWLTLPDAGRPDRRPIANDSSSPPVEREDDRPLVNRIVTPAPQVPSPESEPSLDEPSVDQPSPAPQIATDVPRRATVPQHVVPNAPKAERTAMTIRSEIGALLIDVGNHGPLRVAKGIYSLAEPLRLVSLAESWTSMEIPDVGTLVCDGPAEATIASWGDGVLEIQLLHGKLGIQRLPAGQRIRFQAGESQWLARGVDNYSTLAVVHDLLAPSLFVPAGAVAIDDVPVAAQQIVRMSTGVVQPPQPIAAGVEDSASDPLAGRWLEPPDETRRKKWHAQHGKLLEKLAIIDDVSTELPLLFAASKDARQAALLSQWNLSIADEATRVKQSWAMLNDRRELVRTAGVRYLIDLPAGDPRLSNSIRFARVQLGDEVGGRVAQWMKTAHQPGQIAPAQAVEMAEFLGHRDLAVRHLAISLLELHAGPALARARRQPPAFDAAGPISKRAAAQREWRQLIRQIFAPARNAPAALAPNAAAPNAGVMQQNLP